MDHHGLSPVIQDLVEALHKDLVKTYGKQLTLDYLEGEASGQMAGIAPRGGPGIILHSYLVKAGHVTQ